MEELYQFHNHLSGKKEKAKQYYETYKNNPKHKGKLKIRSKQYRIINRNELFNVLGGAKCKICGFNDKRALQFDHINGDGILDRKILKNSKNMYVYYKNHPEEARQKLQVLCANCNWIKRSELNEVRT